MATWQLQDAKAKLSQVIETARKQGPQIITQRGVESAAVISISELRRLTEKPKRTLLEVLQSGPQYDLQIPPRGAWRMRKPVKF